jgi:hypothetical protein
MIGASSFCVQITHRDIKKGRKYHELILQTLKARKLIIKQIKVQLGENMDSYHRGPSSLPGQSMWDFLWTK